MGDKKALDVTDNSENLAETIKKRMKKPDIFQFSGLLIIISSTVLSLIFLEVVLMFAFIPLTMIIYGFMLLFPNNRFVIKRSDLTYKWWMILLSVINLIWGGIAGFTAFTQVKGQTTGFKVLLFIISMICLLSFFGAYANIKKRESEKVEPDHWVIRGLITGTCLLIINITVFYIMYASVNRHFNTNWEHFYESQVFLSFFFFGYILGVLSTHLRRTLLISVPLVIILSIFITKYILR